MKCSIEVERNRLREQRDIHTETIIKYRDRVSDLETKLGGYESVSMSGLETQQLRVRVRDLRNTNKSLQAQVRELEEHLMERGQAVNALMCEKTKLQARNLELETKLKYTNYGSGYADVLDKMLAAEKRVRELESELHERPRHWVSAEKHQEVVDRLTARVRKLEALVARCGDWFEMYVKRDKELETLLRVLGR